VTELRDPTLDMLLDLDGQVLVIDPTVATGLASSSREYQFRRISRMASTIH
jgi:hypothetical protein